MLHDGSGNLGGVSLAPFGLHEMKADFMAFRWCVRPRSQAAAAYEFIAAQFKNRPVLNTVFFETRHLGPQFLENLLITERAAKKCHDVGVAPETSRERKVVFFPST